MPASQIQLDDLLQELNNLHDEILYFRQQALDLDAGLASVWRDYIQHLGEVNAEAERLKSLQSVLKSQLSSRPIIALPTADVPLPAADPPMAEFDNRLLDNLELIPPALQADPRDAQKRALADHIEYFISDSDREPVMQVINAILSDDTRDLADMLEAMAWGPIWMARADWETLEDQYARLVEWQHSLKNRRVHWQGEIHRLKNDGRYSLLQECQVRTREQWMTYLAQMARDQQEEVNELAREVAILEGQWQLRQADQGAYNA